MAVRRNPVSYYTSRTCPFCGSSDLEFSYCWYPYDIEGKAGKHGTAVVCHNCYARGPEFLYKDFRILDEGESAAVKLFDDRLSDSPTLF
jgi:hypothetical protein